jgi:hypothetical protein
MSPMEGNLRAILVHFVAQYSPDAKLWPVDKVTLLLAAYRLLRLFEESDDAE